MTGKRRVVTIVLEPLEGRIRGRLKDRDGESVVGDDRSLIVQTLESLALMQLAGELRTPGAPLIKMVEVRDRGAVDDCGARSPYGEGLAR